jgi:hypothetical protein
MMKNKSKVNDNEAIGLLLASSGLHQLLVVTIPSILEQSTNSPPEWRESDQQGRLASHIA